MYWIFDDEQSPPVEREPAFLEYLDGVSRSKEEVPAVDPQFTPAGHFGAYQL